MNSPLRSNVGLLSLKNPAVSFVAFPSATLTLVAVYEGPSIAPVGSSYGEVLFNPFATNLALAGGPAVGGSTAYSFPVPNDPTLYGFVGTAQGAILGEPAGARRAGMRG